MRVFGYLTVFVLLVLACSSFGALSAYLYLAGEQQGPIDGSVTIKGRENSIMVRASELEAVAVRDEATGMPTGKRQHKPFVITKEFDQSTPLLFNALAGNERMERFELSYWRALPTGSEYIAYTVQLYGARLCGIKQVMLNNAFSENVSIREMDQLSFTYDSMTVEWNERGITGQIGWDYHGSRVNLTDLSGDGTVDIIDLAILADDWLARSLSAN